MKRLLALGLLGVGIAVALAVVPASQEAPLERADLLERETIASVAGLEVMRVRYRGDAYHVVEVDLGRRELHLLGQGVPLRTFADLDAHVASEGAAVVMATNAGIYHPNYEPAGLHIEAGVMHQPLEHGSGGGNFYLKPNGVFFVDERGARVVETEAYEEAAGDVKLATQSGPLLVRDGALHPAFQKDSPNLRLRSGVGVAAPDRVVFAISEGEVRFHDLATLFRDVLNCGDALYLDGVISGLKAPGVPLESSAASMTYAGLLAVVE